MENEKSPINAVVVPKLDYRDFGPESPIQPAIDLNEAQNENEIAILFADAEDDETVHVSDFHAVMTSILEELDTLIRSIIEDNDSEDDGDIILPGDMAYNGALFEQRNVDENGGLVNSSTNDGVY